MQGFQNQAQRPQQVQRAMTGQVQSTRSVSKHEGSQQNRSKMFLGVYQKIQKNLYEKYSSSQNYYYTKDVNEILYKQEGTKSLIRFKDFVCLDDTQEQYFQEIYEIGQYQKMITYLTEYYKFHNDIPRLFMEPLNQIMNFYHDQQRKIKYVKISRMLQLQSEQPKQSQDKQNQEKQQQISAGGNDPNNQNKKKSKKMPQNSMEKLLAPLESFLLNYSKRNEESKNKDIENLSKNIHKNQEDVQGLNESLRTLHDLKSKLADIVGKPNHFGDQNSIATSVLTSFQSVQGGNPLFPQEQQSIGNLNKFLQYQEVLDTQADQSKQIQQQQFKQVQNKKLMQLEQYAQNQKEQNQNKPSTVNAIRQTVQEAVMSRAAKKPSISHQPFLQSNSQLGIYGSSLIMSGPPSRHPSASSALTAPQNNAKQEIKVSEDKSKKQKSQGQQNSAAHTNLKLNTMQRQQQSSPKQSGSISSRTQNASSNQVDLEYISQGQGKSNAESRRRMNSQNEGGVTSRKQNTSRSTSNKKQLSLQSSQFQSSQPTTLNAFKQQQIKQEILFSSQGTVSQQQQMFSQVDQNKFPFPLAVTVPLAPSSSSQLEKDMLRKLFGPNKQKTSSQSTQQMIQNNVSKTKYPQTQTTEAASYIEKHQKGVVKKHADSVHVGVGGSVYYPSNVWSQPSNSPHNIREQEGIPSSRLGINKGSNAQQTFRENGNKQQQSSQQQLQNKKNQSQNNQNQQLFSQPTLQTERGNSRCPSSPDRNQYGLAKSKDGPLTSRAPSEEVEELRRLYSQLRQKTNQKGNGSIDINKENNKQIPLQQSQVKTLSIQQELQQEQSQNLFPNSSPQQLSQSGQFNLKSVETFPHFVQKARNKSHHVGESQQQQQIELNNLQQFEMLQNGRSNQLQFATQQQNAKLQNKGLVSSSVESLSLAKSLSIPIPQSRNVSFGNKKGSQTTRGEDDRGSAKKMQLNLNLIPNTNLENNQQRLLLLQQEEKKKSEHQLLLVKKQSANSKLSSSNNISNSNKSISNINSTAQTAFQLVQNGTTVQKFSGKSLPINQQKNSSSINKIEIPRLQLNPQLFQDSERKPQNVIIDSSPYQGDNYNSLHNFSTLVQTNNNICANQSTNINMYNNCSTEIPKIANPNGTEYEQYMQDLLSSNLMNYEPINQPANTNNQYDSYTIQSNQSQIAQGNGFLTDRTHYASNVAKKQLHPKKNPTFHQSSSGKSQTTSFQQQQALSSPQYSHTIENKNTKQGKSKSSHQRTKSEQLMSQSMWNQLKQQSQFMEQQPQLQQKSKQQKNINQVLEKSQPQQPAQQQLQSGNILTNNLSASRQNSIHQKTPQQTQAKQSSFMQQKQLHQPTQKQQQIQNKQSNQQLQQQLSQLQSNQNNIYFNKIAQTSQLISNQIYAQQLNSNYNSNNSNNSNSIQTVPTSVKLSSLQRTKQTASFSNSSQSNNINHNSLLSQQSQQVFLNNLSAQNQQTGINQNQYNGSMQIQQSGSLSLVNTNSSYYQSSSNLRQVAQTQQQQMTEENIFKTAATQPSSDQIFSPLLSHLQQANFKLA